MLGKRSMVVQHIPTAGRDLQVQEAVFAVGFLGGLQEDRGILLNRVVDPPRRCRRPTFANVIMKLLR